MKKSAFFAAVVLCAASFSSCTPSYAAPLENSFVGDEGNSFNLNTAVTIEKTRDTINVLTVDGVTRKYGDASGTLWTKISAATFFVTNYAYAYATLYVNTTMPSWATCDAASNNSVLYYANTRLGALPIQDGCAVINAIRAAH